jgi:hypothetical protein
LNDNLLKIDLNTRLAVNPNLVLRVEDDDCGLLFDPDNGTVQMLNETAIAIWQRLDGQSTLREVIDSLQDLYAEISPEADQQALRLVNQLAGLGAVGVWEKG